MSVNSELQMLSREFRQLFRLVAFLLARSHVSQRVLARLDLVFADDKSIPCADAVSHRQSLLQFLSFEIHHDASSGGAQSSGELKRVTSRFLADVCDEQVRCDSRVHGGFFGQTHHEPLDARGKSKSLC